MRLRTILNPRRRLPPGYRWNALKDHMTRYNFRVLWKPTFALLIFLGIHAAINMMRYQPVPDDNLFVTWDRVTHRYCVLNPQTNAWSCSNPLRVGGKR